MKIRYLAGVLGAGMAFALADSAYGLDYDQLSPRVKREYDAEVKRSVPLWLAFLKTCPGDLLRAYDVLGMDTLTKARVVFGNPPATFVDPAKRFLGLTLDLTDDDPLIYILPAFQDGPEDVRITVIHEGCHALWALKTNEMVGHDLRWASCMVQMGLPPEVTKD